MKPFFSYFFPLFHIHDYLFQKSHTPKDHEFRVGRPTRAALRGSPCASSQIQMKHRGWPRDTFVHLANHGKTGG
ncbi:hypothetical protein J2Y44_006695 [Dyadobacter sp. BE32]|uniref:Uncharacterized protein n=1 Tax=Dyadobacter fermentans TaxID=94254 RepID=A0ABU1RAN8_9BACT|nr:MULTISPECIES: hypothetical protein [Dyadobacter]MDR6809650.1 hypothetical protein [Dyadobacter fermentans]MDR7047328.1 hypothetical protein [Dyadobacter sp. BE242]MDR7267172.1 hypothetical protein [Dyadobacter sp. BE32]